MKETLLLTLLTLAGICALVGAFVLLVMFLSLHPADSKYRRHSVETTAKITDLQRARGVPYTPSGEQWVPILEYYDEQKGRMVTRRADVRARLRYKKPDDLKKDGVKIQYLAHRARIVDGRFVKMSDYGGTWQGILAIFFGVAALVCFAMLSIVLG